MEPPQHEREIVFEECFNFRDLGGYATSDGRRTRWRRLFRSDHLAYLTARDCQRMERDLGIATVLDLRDSARASQSPAKLNAKCVNLPLLSDDAVARMQPKIAEVSPRTFMQDIRDEATAAILADVFSLLADESSYPLVFHCMTGKDRTGVVAALVLSVLGVADEDIARDYAMTEPNMARSIERLRKQGRLPADDSFTAEIPRSFFETPPDAMLSLLHETREQHASIRGYVTSCGVDAATLAGLERALLTADT
jgi:protein-tyrosine phosphatase